MHGFLMAMVSIRGGISLYFGKIEILIPDLFRLWRAICGTGMEYLGSSGFCK